MTPRTVTIDFNFIVVSRICRKSIPINLISSYKILPVSTPSSDCPGVIISCQIELGCCRICSNIVGAQFAAGRCPTICSAGGPGTGSTPWTPPTVTGDPYFAIIGSARIAFPVHPFMVIGEYFPMSTTCFYSPLLFG